MGYTHYWYRAPKLGKKKFIAFIDDCKKINEVMVKLDIPLAGSLGKGEPIFSPTKIAINGLEKCGHATRELGITWPAKGAKGVSYAYVDEGEAVKDEKIAQQADENGRIVTLVHDPHDIPFNHSDIGDGWFAGVELKSRTCDGDCSHESFIITETYKPKGDYDKPKEEERYFDCTKTAYKPYDLAVNCFLICAKHHFGKDFKVHSDGDTDDWEDGRRVCQRVLGYGREFELDED